MGDRVKNHEAWGVGVYTYFRDNEVWMETGIRAPMKEGIKFHNSMTVFLNGKGGVKHVLDYSGEATYIVNDRRISYQCEW